MKYIDADKIRTEIKRLKAENNCGTDEFIAAKDIAYDKVFDFLEILEEPVTDCHDLEEAKEEYLRKARMTPGHEWMTRDIEDAFKAGAEWMAKQGVSYQATISADKTIPVLPMKDVSDMGLDYGDKVRIIILPEEG